MHLKSLTLRGFKSFAKPTTFRFETGITCVVGPNGSGKSNVVDALSWVMGEQGARSLRGNNMSDVIFAGSSDKAGLGRAQVELTIDNADGALPIDYSEVTISRTLFRGGGSEYAINGSSVRLLDVQELLSDTGMGKQMHVIVGQGQLDAVLRATPEERRAFIDEAAGVLKHRRRKERALRKLEGMDQNLLRVHDLTDEIRRQLKPLARQAKAARAASGIIAEIEEARSRLAADDLVTARERHQRDAKLAARAQEQLAEAEQSAQGLESQLAELTRAAEQSMQKQQSFAELTHQLDSVRQKLSATASIATERLAAARPAHVIAESEVTLAEERAALANAAKEKAEAKLTEAEQGAAAATSARRELEQKHRQVQAQLEAAQGRLAALQAEAAQAQNQASIAESRLEEAQQGLERAKHDCSEAVAALESTPLPEEENRDESSALEKQHSALREREQELRRELEEWREKERVHTAELSLWRARRESLTIPEPPVGDGGAWDPQGTLDSRLSVEPGWELAINALLGEFDTAALIVPGDSISAGLAWSANEDTPLRAVVLGGSELGTGAAEEQGNAAAKVTAEPEVKGALNELLAGAWVAEDLTEAEHLLQRSVIRKVATRDGVVLTRHTVAGIGHNRPSVLVTRAEYKRALEQETAAEARLQELEQLRISAEARVREAEREVAESLQQLRAADAAAAEAAQRRAAQQAKRQSAQDRVRRAEESVLASENRLQQAKERLEEAAEKSRGISVPDKDQFLAEFTEALQVVASQVEEARQREITARLNLQQAQTSAQTAVRAARDAAETARSRRHGRDASLAAEAAAQARSRRLEEIRRRAEAGAIRATEVYAAAVSLKEQAEEENQRLSDQLSQMREQSASRRTAQAERAEHRHQAEVALAQSAMALSEAERRASELSEDLDLLIRNYGPTVPLAGETVGEDTELVPYDRNRVVEQLERAEKRLSRLGVVNPMAVEEHKAMQERLAFLEEQVGDLQKSKTDLLAIIRDVDEKIESTFVAAFEEVSAQFSEVFDGLFPGGKGRLDLTDPSDPLHTGVTIYARPAGKKVTHLSLLSGGERSLAAMAYLIAIFKARPSPFYVMDEVEAALDDINLSRVLAILEQLRRDSQLILITHQKRTMEIADALYGVSMRGGVSTVVSHKL